MESQKPLNHARLIPYANESHFRTLLKFPRAGQLPIGHRGIIWSRGSVEVEVSKTTFLRGPERRFTPYVTLFWSALYSGVVVFT